MYKYLILQALSAAAMAFIVAIFTWRSKTVRKVLKRYRKWLFASKLNWILTSILVLSAGVYFHSTHPYPINFAMPPHMQSVAPGQKPPSIPILNLFEFVGTDFEKVDNIGADPNAVPHEIEYDRDGVVRFDLTAQEVIGDVIDGVQFNYWTYNGQAPGPMMRVKVGDMVEVSLTNHPSSIHPHNIDLHAVTGPGGGGAVTKVMPGETKSFSWQAMAPGIYIYHCATANISTHNAHGQYGLILVEPEESMEPVDKEFYVVQGELYTTGGIGNKGLQVFDSQGLLDGNPTYVTFNGKVEDAPRMHAQVGDRIRMYVGNGGVNLISSFHVIGEIFDKVYPEGSLYEESVLKDVQTTAVLPGGAVVVEFTVDIPGDYALVDHALARMNKGAWAILHVEGEENPEIFEPLLQ